MIPFIWALFGLLMMLSEFFIPGFVIFFFGSGAIITSILTLLVPFIRITIPLQLLIWLAASGITLFSLRRYLSKIFKGKLIGKENDDEFIGKKVLVVEKISPESPGRIRLLGTTWRAESYDEVFESGEYVEIIEKKNMTFAVTGKILEDES
jgi:membrane protein implicated in regulation of membrane protease activity